MRRLPFVLAFLMIFSLGVVVGRITAPKVSGIGSPSEVPNKRETGPEISKPAMKEEGLESADTAFSKIPPKPSAEAPGLAQRHARKEIPKKLPPPPPHLQEGFFPPTGKPNKDSDPFPDIKNRPPLSQKELEDDFRRSLLYDAHASPEDTENMVRGLSGTLFPGTEGGQKEPIAEPEGIQFPPIIPIIPPLGENQNEK